MWRINRRNKEVLQNTNRRDINVALVALKLILVLGITEGIGFIQIIKENKTDSEVMFNIVVGLVYSIVRGLRSLMIMIVYLCTGEILQMYIARFRRIFRINEDQVSPPNNENNNDPNQSVIFLYFKSSFFKES